MTLWQIITGNSSLPVQAGTTFWDHLNNQLGGAVVHVGPVLLADINAPALSAHSGDGISASINDIALTANLSLDTSAQISQTTLEAQL